MLGPNRTSRWIEGEYSANTSFNAVYLMDHLLASEEYLALSNRYAYVKVNSVTICVYSFNTQVRTQWLMQWVPTSYDDDTIVNSDATKIIPVQGISVKKQTWLPPPLIIRAGTDSRPIRLNGWNSTVELKGVSGSTNIYPGRLLIHTGVSTGVPFRLSMHLSFAQGTMPSSDALASELMMKCKVTEAKEEIERAIKLEKEKKKKVEMHRLKVIPEGCEAREEPGE